MLWLMLDSTETVTTRHALSERHNEMEKCVVVINTDVVWDSQIREINKYSETQHLYLHMSSSARLLKLNSISLWTSRSPKSNSKKFKLPQQHTDLKNKRRNEVKSHQTREWSKVNWFYTRRETDTALKRHIFKSIPRQPPYNIQNITGNL